MRTRKGKTDTLAEVVVTADRATTATKTDAKLIETPQAISVITAEQIMDRGARLIEEATRYSAGVTAEPYGLDSRKAGCRGLWAAWGSAGGRRRR